MTPLRALLTILLLALTPAVFAAPSANTAHPSPLRKPRFLMAHYMPWFQAKPTSADWGWHWTMGHYHPDTVTQGRREAASKYYPLMGLYDSSDPDALDCQVLLMKLAGIDGVLIDWYGTDDYLDFGQNHRNTLQMIRAVKKAGLRFAIVYEDQTVPKLIAGHIIPETDAVSHGKQMLAWMQAHWFSDPAYLTLNGRPVFLVFGNGYYSSAQWTQIFAGLPQPPLYFTEEYRREPAVGGFAWPQPSGGTDGSFRALDQFYTRSAPWPQAMPAAWPRFDDIYAQAGVHDSWGHIDDRDGQTYAETLERALKSDASVIQLVTWNDWGEGTQIEPSVEFGYRDLETTQRERRRYLDPKFSPKPQYLRLPLALYELQKKSEGNPALRAKLAVVSRLMFAGQWDRARALLAKINLPAP
ncbi:MAG: glycoside hydrolase family 71/99-like protein [Armatimonadota bacterium]|nr:glycoside hydrolase family 71/99-like protein [Armatimonadota bacterium]